MTTRSLCSRKTEQGFSLIEVLIAISILAIGLLAVASMQGSASKNNVLAGSRTEAATLASEQMETLMSLALQASYWGISPPTTDLNDSDGDGAAGLGDQGFDGDATTQGDADNRVTRGRYTVYWNVEDNATPAADPSKNIITKTINLIVIWSDYGGSGRLSMQRVIPRIS